MQNEAILVLIVAVAGLFATSSMARSDLNDLRVAAEITEEQVVDKLLHIKGESNVPRPPECCNECGICDRRDPQFARCQCLDLVPKCHPSCQYCEQALQFIYPPLFRCLDVNFVSYLTCGEECSVTPSKSIIN